MTVDVLPAAQALDLTNCEQEPIRIPGCIQPHGVLLVLAEPDLQIIHVSDNLFDMLGTRPCDVVGQHLSVLFDQQHVAEFQGYAALVDISVVNPVAVHMRAPSAERRSFHALLHRVAAGIVCELEPIATAHPIEFLSLYHHVRHALGRMNGAESFKALCQQTADDVRYLSGFDRVMIYQFDRDWNGSVIAESKVDDIGSYHGLRFPASDIPKQARDLYLQNWLRVIVDVNYVPVSIVPTLHPDTGQPLDLSAAVLRSVSPMHLQYLKNMDVRATLTISLISDNTLWGLIVCHHRTPRFVPYDIRVACEFIGQLCSSQIAMKQSREDAGYEQQIRVVQAQVLAALCGPEAVIETLTRERSALLSMLGASGVVVWMGQQCLAHGTTPDPELIVPLVDWVASQPEDVVVTDALPADYPARDDMRTLGSGILAIAISKVEQHYLLWFRPEVIHTVTWGGNPYKPVAISADGLQLSPRTSFERWKEQVRGTSLPWKACEVAAAKALRLKLVDCALSQSAAVRREQDEVIQLQTAMLAELSTPLIPINDDVLVMPLIGTVDSQRAQQVLETLLSGIAQSGVRIAILDITGVVVVDTQVANALVQAAQAVQLLGAQVVLTGIRPEIAQTLVGLGVELRGIVTQNNLQMGIAYAMHTDRVASGRPGRWR